MEEILQLLLNTIIKAKDDDNDIKKKNDNEDKNIKNIVSKRVGLKRKLKPKTTLGASKTTRNSRNSIKSRL